MGSEMCIRDRSRGCLILDEPLTGIDVARKEITKTWLIEKVSTHMLSVLVASHDLDFLTSTCDNILVINKLSHANLVSAENTAHDLKESIIDFLYDNKTRSKVEGH